MSDFMQVAELYRGHAGFDVHALVAELVDGRVRSLPACAALQSFGAAQTRHLGTDLGATAA